MVFKVKLTTAKKSFIIAQIKGNNLFLFAHNKSLKL